jgi:DNA-binding NarL/FixJ family response regulator
MSSKIRILIGDDHPVVLDGLLAILETQPDFDVVAQATGGEELIHKFNAHRPDLVLLDLEMPDVDGVEALRRLKAIAPDVRAIAFTAFDTDERIVEAVKAGVQGYLLKGSPRDQLFSAIRIVHSGGSLLQPIVASKLMRQFQDQPSAQTNPLTEREQEVLVLLAQGLPNKEIADALHVTERTVKFHVSAILGKLDAGNRTEAVTIAAQRGWVALSG